MSKLLELVGFALIGGTIYAFVVPIPNQEPYGWPLFWVCSVGALAIIIHRHMKRKRLQ